MSHERQSEPSTAASSSVHTSSMSGISGRADGSSTDRDSAGDPGPNEALAANPSTADWYQATQPVMWVMAACLLLTAPLQFIALGSQLRNPAALALALAVAAVQLLVLWCIASLLLAGRSTPLPYRVAALGWGALVVPVIAAWVNTRAFETLTTLGLHSFAASIAAPLSEDTLRAVGTFAVLVLAARHRITPLHGAMYGFLVGSGFEVAENLSYILGVEDPAGQWQLALVRSGLGFGLHALWSGITGAAIAYCLSLRQRGPVRGAALIAAIATLIAGYVLPLLLHALWDAPALSIRPQVGLLILYAIYAASIATFLAVAMVSRRRA